MPTNRIHHAPMDKPGWQNMRPGAQRSILLSTLYILSRYSRPCNSPCGLAFNACFRVLNTATGPLYDASRLYLLSLSDAEFEDSNSSRALSRHTPRNILTAQVVAVR